MANQPSPTDAAATIDHAPPGPAASAEPALIIGGPSDALESTEVSGPKKKKGKVSLASHIDCFNSPPS